MDLLKSLLTVSVIGAAVYFLGVLLVEASAAPEQMVVPRSRKQRYWLRSFGFLEYFAGFVLLFSISILKKDSNDKFYTIALVTLFSLIAIKLLLFVALANTKKFAEYALKSRMNTKYSSLLIIIWFGTTTYLFRHVNSEETKVLAYGLTAYGFFMTVLIKARLVDFFIRVSVEVELKSGEQLTGYDLLDETNDFFVLGADKSLNLLIPKSEVRKLCVWQSHPFDKTHPSPQQKIIFDSKIPTQK